MDISKFTEKLQEAVAAAENVAARFGHQQMDVEHLLMALLEQERGLVRSILQRRMSMRMLFAGSSKKNSTRCQKSLVLRQALGRSM